MSPPTITTSASSNGDNQRSFSPSTTVSTSVDSPYQRSSSINMGVSSNSKIETDSLNFLHRFFRSFSLEQGYEQPPHQNSEEDDILDEEAVMSIRKNLSKQLPQDNNDCKRRYLVIRLLLVVLLVGIARAVWYQFFSQKGPIIVYTGDDLPADGNFDSQKISRLKELKHKSALENIPKGAVAADHPTCSKIGVSIMQDFGGNAVDAAVATALCLGIANPSSSGIGGGAFILIHASPEGLLANRSLPEFHDARSVPGDDNLLNENNNQQTRKLTEVIDCREVAGEHASTLMYQQPDTPKYASTRGGLAIAVPGELRGLELAHARFGRLKWATVVQPAIKLARRGIPVYPHLAEDIAMMNRIRKTRGDSPTLRKLLTHNDNWSHVLKEGELIKNEKLADTLEAIAKSGSNAMYEGERAKGLVQDIQNAGGILTVNDFESYRPTIRSPVISDNVFGFHVVGVPPPSSGGAAIIGALRFLVGYSSPLASLKETLSIHRITEALKHVFSIRMSMSDPAFEVPNPVTNATNSDAVQALVEGTYMETLRQATSDDWVLNLSHYGGPQFAQLKDTDGQKEGQDAKEGDRRRRRRLQQRRLSDESGKADPFGYLYDHGTSHLSVVDRDGNAVAMTTSINAQFGSNVVSESTGIVLNNEMDDFGNPGVANYFGLVPSEANFIKPFKKPLSSMSPTMVFQIRQSDLDESDKTNNLSMGDLRLVLGGSGGPKIISAVVQVIVNYLMIGRSLFESVSHPRIHEQLIYHGSAAVTVENSVSMPPRINLQVSNRTETALIKRGHRLLKIDYAGTVQAIAVDPDVDKLLAVCDIRKGGSPLGY